MELLEEMKMENENLETLINLQNECFDKSSQAFENMMNILVTAYPRGLVKEKGYELHHVVPRSVFKKLGLKVIDENNLVKLTYSEHVLVHYYASLCATEKYKKSLTYAFRMMLKYVNKTSFLQEDTIILIARDIQFIKEVSVKKKAKSRTNRAGKTRS